MSNRLEGQEIYRRIPHAGAMCLLDTVEAWDAEGIVCTAHSHANPDHPLRQDGCLRSVHAVEYAAQAAALHASLVGEPKSVQRVYIAALHAIELCEQSLDDEEMAASPLHVRARLAASNASAARYAFSVACGPVCVARGAMTVATPE